MYALKFIVRRTTPVPPSTTQFFEGKSDFIPSLIISEYKSEITNHCTASTLGHAKLLFIYNVQNSKLKCNDWLLADTCPQTANLALYFECKNELQFYNLVSVLLVDLPF